MSFRARCLLPALAALALSGCADSPRRTDKIVAPVVLDASGASALLECPTSQSASALGLLGVLEG